MGGHVPAQPWPRWVLGFHKLQEFLAPSLRPNQSDWDKIGA